jgi:isocitrate/isopropylmalate dehydrogenase
MAHRITLIPGGGTGPEIVEATRRVLEATGVEFDWDVQEAGVDVMEKYGTPLDDPTAVGTSQYADAIIEKLEASKVCA